MAVFVNLTDQQKDLLVFLVANHEKHGGKEFFYMRTLNGAGFTYSHSDSYPATCDDLDLFQLRQGNFINLAYVSQNIHRGKPTQLGIITAHRLRQESTPETVGKNVPDLDNTIDPPTGGSAEVLIGPPLPRSATNDQPVGGSIV